MKLKLAIVILRSLAKIRRQSIYRLIDKSFSTLNTQN